MARRPCPNTTGPTPTKRVHEPPTEVAWRGEAILVTAQEREQRGLMRR
eukprot:CAMPEP_0119537340 /NCGR_PEP_ID=MMETSP1344-20130328/50031_1 /TAXON_ID=236787 /ORGANISM="Florenciella parvula, Strain CCMP2471" /LENGTH=47 /DNA_ID= /DNA_START= /DNA_END= /DNA_ORIENTATION=